MGFLSNSFLHACMQESVDFDPASCVMGPPGSRTRLEVANSESSQAVNASLSGTVSN